MGEDGWRVGSKILLWNEHHDLWFFSGSEERLRSAEIFDPWANKKKHDMVAGVYQNMYVQRNCYLP